MNNQKFIWVAQRLFVSANWHQNLIRQNRRIWLRYESRCNEKSRRVPAEKTAAS